MDPILPLKKLLIETEVGTDNIFREFLSTHSHCDEFIAPASLRQVLSQFKVVRVEFGLVYAVEEGFPILSCWMGELGVRGRVDAVQENLNKIMRELGFKAGKPDPNADDTTIFPRTLKNVEEEARFRGPHKWTGAKEASCGFQVFWRIQGRTKTEMPTLDALLAVLPILRDTRVDNHIYTDLGNFIVQSLSFGGTWTRHYTWDVTLAPGNADEMYQHLQQLLKNLGYVPDKDSGDYTTWERRSTRSFAYLTRADEDNRINLRIQPES